MRKELEELALIDAYINNELDGDQLNKTEELIQQNPDFAAKVENQKLIIKIILRQQQLQAKQKDQSVQFVGKLMRVPVRDIPYDFKELK